MEVLNKDPYLLNNRIENVFLQELQYYFPIFIVWYLIPRTTTVNQIYFDMEVENASLSIVIILF